MPHLYGPLWPRRVDRRRELGPYEPYDEPPFPVRALLLGEALLEYAKAFDVRIEPYDGEVEGLPLLDEGVARYFYHIDAKGISEVVDIHVQRNGTWICPKQNLSFILLEADYIEIGALIC